MEIINDTLWCCQDCLMIIANDDASGMDDATETDCRKGIERLSERGYLTLNDNDDDKEFSSRPCDVCGTPLAGSRHHLALLADTPATGGDPGPTCARCGKQCMEDLCANCRSDEEDERGY